ncbi:hypothetical protein GLOIN_2v1473341 [Rhizophagus clarus]|uniref:SAM domain-containing protein n=1 Tax=Rhizophagus clarus TaxID=94130 RepID=A0A8H3LHH5_9GLOM|nr:hypothetical protein GLOIN_2v1473341 [Rhizophagus clarus]
MAEISTCKYLLGTCYTCQKCLYCFKTPQKNLCKCKKSKQPARVNNPKREQQIYQRVFTPNQPIPTANEFLFTANTKFSYNSNLMIHFHILFVQHVTVNSKDVENDTFSEDKDNSSAIEDNNVKGNNNIESDNSVKGNNNMKEMFGIEKDSEEYNSQEDNSEEEDSEKRYKTLTIQPANYKNVMEKINSIVQKVLGKKIKSTNYTTSYKAMNAHRPSNELEDELDFQEFLDEYKNKKHKKSSDESNSSSVEEEIDYDLKKRRNHVQLEKQIYQRKKRNDQKLSRLYVKRYKCNIHTTSCYIQDHRHLQLNLARLQLWINKGTTYEILPSFLTFDIVKSDVSVNKNNLITQAQVSQAPPTTPAVTPIIFQLPPQFYQNSNVQGHQDHPHQHYIHLIIIQIHHYHQIPNYLQLAFLEEAITVNAIKDLSDEQLQKLGVVKIGWQKNIKQASTTILIT